jgi:hypothetical protein
MSIHSLKEGIADGLAPAARAFTIVPISGIVLFAALFAIAIAKVRNSDVHKRLMLVNTVGLLQRLERQGYTDEDVLQGLLAQYPDLLAGDDMGSDVPRRWLLVSRECGVPDQQGVFRNSIIRRNSTGRSSARNTILTWPASRLVLTRDQNASAASGPRIVGWPSRKQ